MNKIMDMFSPKTKKEKTNDVVATAEILKDMDALKQLGKDMLADERYEKYRKGLDELMGKALRSLLTYQHPDNNIYSANIRVIITQLNDLLYFLNMPVNFLNHVKMQEIPEK